MPQNDQRDHRRYYSHWLTIEICTNDVFLTMRSGHHKNGLSKLQQHLWHLSDPVTWLLPHPDKLTMAQWQADNDLTSKPGSFVWALKACMALRSDVDNSFSWHWHLMTMKPLTLTCLLVGWVCSTNIAELLGPVIWEDWSQIPKHKVVLWNQQ